jgi:cullin 3
MPFDCIGSGLVCFVQENSKYSNINIRRTSAKVFAEEVLRDEKSNFHLADTFLRGVWSLRKGEDVKIGQLKCIVDAYLSASIRGEKDEDTLYARDLQKPYLQETEEFYSVNGNEWFNSGSVSGYLRKVSDVIASEKEQVAEYLPKETVAKVALILLSELVEKYDQRLIVAEKDGLNEMLRDLRTEDISIMFSLMIDVMSSRELMAEQFRRFLEKDGMLLVEKHAQASSLSMIECARDVLKFHKTYSDLASECFHSSYEHMTGLRKGFQRILKMEIKDATTKRDISLSEIFCVYCDAIQRLFSFISKFTNVKCHWNLGK